MNKPRGAAGASVYYPELRLHWHVDPCSCPHFNQHACATCDHDFHYRDRITRLDEESA